MSIQSADDIAALTRRLLENEQQLRTVIASAGSGQPPAVMASSHAEQTDPAALACALLDAEGVIVHASSAWQQQHTLGGLLGTAGETRVGINFLEVCDRASKGPSTVAHRLAAGIRSMRDGKVACSRSTSWALLPPPLGSTSLDWVPNCANASW